MKKRFAFVLFLVLLTFFFVGFSLAAPTQSPLITQNESVASPAPQPIPDSLNPYAWQGFVTILLVFLFCAIIGVWLYYPVLKEKPFFKKMFRLLKK